jgi:hypothetical protein
MAHVIHVWDTLEVVLQARGTYENPYTQVSVWVDLKGPDFSQRCHGFWDGGRTFRVRLTAPVAGEWHWTSGAEPTDPGLVGRKGSFEAAEWSDEEKLQNPCRRGFIRATANGHAFEHADGTPFFLMGDTWWAASTSRFPWYDDDDERPLGPGMGLKDAVRFRRAQGYNSVAIIAAHPAWANDGRPALIEEDDGTTLRDAWQQAGTQSAQDMCDETGNRPFEFPGRVPGYEDVVPDLDRINPTYFRCLDRKINYFNSQGFVPFVEPARRDIGPAWMKYHDWPDSYVRYVHHVWSRLQASNCLLSPIHYDWTGHTMAPDVWNAAANRVIELYGPPPFGQPVGCNPAGSSLACFGHVDEARWLTFHQVGNWRTHDSYDALTEAFRREPPVPVLNGEPFYDGWPESNPPGGSEDSSRRCRSAIYGSILSGGLAGHIYGAAGLWPGRIEEEADHTIWDALSWRAGRQMPHAVRFLTSQKARYQELVPDPDCLNPNRSAGPECHEGWAYCAWTPERDFALLYFEMNCPHASAAGLLPTHSYALRWFDPRHGQWLDDAHVLKADESGRADLPFFPGGRGSADRDWGASLTLQAGQS